MAAWSPGGFPSQELYYAFNGTLLAQIPCSEQNTFGPDLLDAGFSFGYTKDGIAYYLKGFSSTGIVSLYS